MEITKNMQDLTENIKAASEARAQDLTNIKKEANALRQEAGEMVKGFTVSRGQTSRQLKADLAQSKTDRRKSVAQSRKNASRMVLDFHDSRHKSGDQLRKDLAESGKVLAQNEKKRQQEMVKMLKTIQGEREANAAELKKDLAEARAEIQAEVKSALADARSLIQGYQTSRQTVGNELKAGLVKDRDQRKADVEGIRSNYRQVQSEVQADLKGAADAWKEMGSASRKKTSGGKAAPEAEPETPVEITPNLEEQLLSIINQHAEGITLSEVAKELGIATIVLGKAAKVLLEQGKVRREEKNYFTVAV